MSACTKARHKVRGQPWQSLHNALFSLGLGNNQIIVCCRVKKLWPGKDLSEICSSTKTEWRDQAAIHQHQELTLNVSSCGQPMQLFYILLNM